jgi:hypothetical protein
MFVMVMIMASLGFAIKVAQVAYYFKYKAVVSKEDLIEYSWCIKEQMYINLFGILGYLAIFIMAYWNIT